MCFQTSLVLFFPPLAHFHIGPLLSTQLTFPTPIFPIFPSYHCILLVPSLAFFSQLHRPFLLPWIAQLLQAGYSHLRVWSQEPQLSENKHHLSFCVWVSSLDVIFSSSIHEPESFMISFGYS